MTRTVSDEQKAAFIALHPHCDPEFSIGGALRPGIVKVSSRMTVCVRTASVHKLNPFWEPIHSTGLAQVDGYEWELFNVSHMGMLNNTFYIWGMYLEGLGAFNQMVPIDHVRNLTPEERETWNKKTLGMYGSHSGTLSATFPSGVQA